MAINRDTIVALCLLVFCGTFIAASFDIEVTDYGTIQSSLWPRIILGALTLFSLVLLAKSVKAPEAAIAAGEAMEGGFFSRYRNALLIYAIFLGFLLALPWLGMLIGGALFVFVALTVLGAPEARLVPIHLAIAVLTVGMMWAIFTFALGVFLPEGKLLRLF
jgi:putative tricarboxylic transport membrane protein